MKKFLCPTCKKEVSQITLMSDDSSCEACEKRGYLLRRFRRERCIDCHPELNENQIRWDAQGCADCPYRDLFLMELDLIVVDTETGEVKKASEDAGKEIKRDDLEDAYNTIYKYGYKYSDISIVSTIIHKLKDIQLPKDFEWVELDEVNNIGVIHFKETPVRNFNPYSGANGVSIFILIIFIMLCVSEGLGRVLSSPAAGILICVVIGGYIFATILNLFYHNWLNKHSIWIFVGPEIISFGYGKKKPDNVVSFNRKVSEVDCSIEVSTAGVPSTVITGKSDSKNRFEIKGGDAKCLNLVKLLFESKFE